MQTTCKWWPSLRKALIEAPKMTTTLRDVVNVNDALRQAGFKLGGRQKWEKVGNYLFANIVRVK